MMTLAPVRYPLASLARKTYNCALVSFDRGLFAKMVDKPLSIQQGQLRALPVSVRSIDS